MIRVVLPYHLRTLARVDGEVQLEVASPITVSSVLDALEARYPALSGTIRDHGTLKRRPFIRFFVCKEDISLESPDIALPAEVVSGGEPFMIVGAMSGGWVFLLHGWMMWWNLVEVGVDAPSEFGKAGEYPRYRIGASTFTWRTRRVFCAFAAETARASHRASREIHMSYIERNVEPPQLA